MRAAPRSRITSASRLPVLVRSDDGIELDGLDPEVQREECEVVLVGAVDAARRIGFGHRELVLRPPFPAAKAESRPGHVKIDPRCGSDRGVSRSVVDLPERGDS